MESACPSNRRRAANSGRDGMKTRYKTAFFRKLSAGNGAALASSLDTDIFAQRQAV